MRRELFDAFWQATAEAPFEVLTASSVECYRLIDRHAHGSEHHVYRMQRPLRESAEGSQFVYHYFVWTENEKPSAWTTCMSLEQALWNAMEVLLNTACFWELPDEDRGARFVHGGATYTLEAWKAGRSHTVTRRSPCPLISGGELLSIVIHYIQQLASLALLEGDASWRAQYHPEYVPKRQVPKGSH
jgi:hypothetical protein